MKETPTQEKSPLRPKTAHATTEMFTPEERAAMKALVRERKAAANKADLEADLLAAIAEMPLPGRTMGERLHAIITAAAPDLSPKTWYGMPAYANKEGKVVCFFRGAEKFKERYMTLGFNQEANLDEGHMWPTAFALTGLTAGEEAEIAALVKKARR